MPTKRIIYLVLILLAFTFLSGCPWFSEPEPPTTPEIKFIYAKDLRVSNPETVKRLYNDDDGDYLVVYGSGPDSRDGFYIDSPFDRFTVEISARVENYGNIENPKFKASGFANEYEVGSKEFSWYSFTHDFRESTPFVYLSNDSTRGPILMPTGRFQHDVNLGILSVKLTSID